MKHDPQYEQSRADSAMGRRRGCFNLLSDFEVQIALYIHIVVASYRGGG